MKTPLTSHRSLFLVTLFCILGLAFSLLPGCGGGGGGGGGANPVGPGEGSTFGNISGTVRFNGVAKTGVDVYLAQSGNIVGQGVSKLLGSQVKAGVRSSILPDATFGDYHTTTDANGAYRFDQVVSGEYTLVAVMDATHQYVQTNVLVGVSAAVTVQDVQLTPTGTLTGSVVAAGAADQSGTLVYLDGTSYVALTDGNGRFTLLNAASGSYFLRTQRPGFTGTSLPVQVLPAQTVSVPALTMTAITLPLPGYGTIIGTATRNPFAYGDFDHAGLMVHLTGTPYVTFTDPNGGYRFQSIPTGSYQLAFPSERYAYSGTPPAVTVLANQDSTVLPVVLPPRNFLQPTGAFSGTVGKTPVLPDETDQSGVLIQIQSASGSYLTTTDASGNFGFNNLPYGSYTVAFPPGRYKHLSGPLSITISATPVSETFTVAPIQFTPLTGGFSGTVTKSPMLPDEADQSGVIVQVQNASGTTYATTDAAGNFSFTKLVRGAYTVSFPPGRYKYLTGPLTVTISGTPTTATYVVAPIQVPDLVGSFSGTVTKTPILPDEADQSGVIVQVQNASGTTYATTDAAGSFAFPKLVQGTYTVSFPPGRYKYLTGPLTVTISGTPTTATYVVAPIQAPALVGSFSGTVTKTPILPDEADQSGVIVQVQNASGTTYATTDAAGSFAFPKLVQGTYTVSFPPGRYKYLTGPLTVTISGTPTTATYVVAPIKLPEAVGGLRGTIVKGIKINGPSENNAVAVKIASATGSFTTVADAAGIFEFQGVPLGSYVLQIADSQYGLSSSYPGYPNPVVTVASPTINIGIVTVDPLVIRSGKISGSIFPVLNLEGEEIALFKEGITSSIAISQIAGDGSFVFPDVPAGTYYLRLRPQANGGRQLTAAAALSFTVSDFQTTVKSGLGIYKPAITSDSLSGTGWTLNGSGFHSAAVVKLNNSTILTPMAAITSDTVILYQADVPPGRSTISIENPDGAFVVYTIQNYLANVPYGSFLGVVTDTQIALTWDAVPGATQYQITYTPGNGVPASPFIAKTTSAKMTGLAASTSYDVSIQPQAVYADETVVPGGTTIKAFVTKAGGMIPKRIVYPILPESFSPENIHLGAHGDKVFLLCNNTVYDPQTQIQSYQAEVARFSTADANFGAAASTPAIISPYPMFMSAGPRLYLYITYGDDNNFVTEYDTASLSPINTQTFPIPQMVSSVAQSANGKTFVCYTDTGIFNLNTYNNGLGTLDLSQPLPISPGATVYMTLSQDSSRVCFANIQSGDIGSQLVAFTNLVGSTTFSPVSSSDLIGSSMYVRSLVPAMNDFFITVADSYSSVNAYRLFKSTDYTRTSTQYWVGEYDQVVFDRKGRAWVVGSSSSGRKSLTPGGGDTPEIRRYDNAQFTTYQTYLPYFPGRDYATVPSTPSYPAISYDPVADKVSAVFFKAEGETNPGYEIFVFDASLD